MATKTFEFSPFGEAKFPWVNRPDVKFKPEGEFKVDLRLKLSDPGVPQYKDKLDALAQAAFDEQTAELTPRDRKNAKLQLPYDVEEDEDGNPTGYITVKFRQNAKIKLKKTGEVKDILVGIKDMKNKDVHAPVFGGSVLRVAYTSRPIKVVSSASYGVRLDFAAVQIKSMAERGSGNRDFGFGTGEGYSADDEAADQMENEAGSHDAPSQPNSEY